ncbi:MAG: hypothetical protein ABIO04_01075 [Ferruginibacter sp.]
MRFKHAILFIINFVFNVVLCSKAQVAVNTIGAAPGNSAILDMQISNKGMLIPRMNTSQINAILNPADGLMIYDTKKNAGSKFFRYKPEVPGTPSYEVRDQEFHYYKKK